MDTIISYNLNGWKPISSLSYSDKIKTWGKYINNTYNGALPAIIGLQEFIAGTGAKYLSEMGQALDGNYTLLTPPDFNHLEHRRSIMNLTMIRKDLEIKGVQVIESELPNRIFDVVVLIDGQLVHLINYYAVQVQNFKGKADWYIKDRRAKHEDLWQALLASADFLKDECVVILGDFQENSKKDGKKIYKLTEMGYCEKVTGFPTVRNEFFSEQSIDHIFYSKKAFEVFKPSSFALDGNLLGDVSDHSMLVAISA